MQLSPNTKWARPLASGLCGCGCGQKTKIAKASNASRGHVRGLPIRFVHGHHARELIRYVAEDRGHETPCWIWQLHTNRDGHGRVQVADGRFVMAHRAMYEEARGPLGPEVHLHHLCDVPSCVNPDHLEPVTPAEHRQRHAAKLTPDAVREMRRLREVTGITYQALADRFGVSLTMAWQVVNRQTWRNI